MREPIYGKEYVGADICEVFKEEGKGDPLYDDEYIPDDICEVFEKEVKEEPIYDEKHVPAEYDESLDVKRSLQTATTKKKLCLVTKFSTCIAPRKTWVVLSLSITKYAKMLHQNIYHKS